MSPNREMAGVMDTTPAILEGERVRLEPITWQHLPDLAEIAFDSTIWRWMSVWVNDHQQLEAFVGRAIAEVNGGRAVVWVTRSKTDGKLAGATRFYEISPQHRTMELGFTWLHPKYHRTGINVEAKYLQLRHAFETMRARRVAFKTHHENLRSQNAIAALGAKREGTFRNHMIMPDGENRHSVWYSVIEEEWQEVKANLELRMRRFPPSALAKPMAEG
jgi:RimJ/RimL family protein N-acetyltransferase